MAASPYGFHATTRRAWRCTRKVWINLEGKEAHSPSTNSGRHNRRRNTWMLSTAHKRGTGAVRAVELDELARLVAR